MYKTLVKPSTDFFFSLIVLFFALPIISIVVFLLIIVNKGNPFFFQRRPGRYGRQFTIIKFKTMNDKKDKYGNLLPDEKRLTRLGHFIRKTSLDELPQLLNVLKGDMSLVGPRPLLVEYIPLYNDYQKRRHEVKPGITGWAQVNGRNAISWEEKFNYDVWYVDNMSFMLDLKIILLTILKVFKSEGISQYGQATAEPFKGNLV